MTRYHGLSEPFRPDWEGLVRTIRRQGTPRRVHFVELFHDGEVRDALAARFDLTEGLRPDDPDFERKKRIAVHRFSGFDYVTASPAISEIQFHDRVTDDAAGLKREGGRAFRDEHTGPITTWEEFERFRWPNPARPEALADLEWYQKHLPGDMCIIGVTGHYFELLSWLMGLETLCYALFDQRDLVAAIARKLDEVLAASVGALLEFDRVRLVWGTDDMGYKTGLLISPRDMREFVLPGHRRAAAMAHAAGRPYLLHSCGNLADIYEDLIADVRIDAKHSFEDTIEDVRELKGKIGRRIALLGGIDVDFLCRSDEAAIRRRVRETLDVCQPGGGYCLGTGNSVANYIPLDHYLAMVDEGRLYGA